MTESSDVVIVGGSVVGCSAAWHLRQDGFTGRIVVVERDPTYTRASAFLAMGGIRQQFCTPVTVQMVQYSVGLWKKFDQRLGYARRRAARVVPPARLPVSRERGDVHGADAALSGRAARRRARAAAVARRDPADRARSMLDDIMFGVLGPDDGYANPREVLFGFRRGAEAAGAEYRRRRGRRHRARTAAASPACGSPAATTISAPVVVNAAGPWAGGWPRWRACDVPIEPMRQMLFRATLPRPGRIGFPW